MRIAVCEDNDLHREMFTCLMNRYAAEKSIRFELITYKNGIGFLCDKEEGAHFDIVFLDIYMDNILGIDIARRLRSDGYKGSIIFLTASPDFALESYDVDADGYLLKPLDYTKLETILDGITYEYKPCTYRICQRSSVINLFFHEILYIESQNAKCIVNTICNEKFTVYKTLNTIEMELNDKRFFRCHQSFLVNMDHVRQIDKQFLLRNGEIIPIRQRGIKSARETFMEYTSQKNPVIECTV
ncbi:MAG: LytR/AlgR family response regulator transcription factor [Eubacteriales bacterium]